MEGQMFTSLKKELIKHRPSLRSWSIGLLSGLLIYPLSYAILSHFVSTPGNVVALNSDTINKVAFACDLLHKNSDIMGRYAHYTVPHTETQMFCMECSGNENYDEEMILDEPIDDLKTRLSQVHKDSLEINKSVATIVNALLIQNETLNNNLRRLRDQSYPK